MSAPETHRTTLSDRYELQGQLGRGGMGIVWRARDTLLQREVAIKEVDLPPELSGRDRDAMQARVMREARTAGRLSHPSAVTVYDVVQQDGRAFIVMELVDAQTLEELVAAHGALAPPHVAEIGLQVLGALDQAHRHGIVHRDVKPANIMVPRGGPAKLADFGIASLKGDPKITATGMLLGSPSYMAPEQAQGDDSGPPADLWALGATLYFALEGEAPFDKGQAIPTLAAVVYDQPRPPRHSGPLDGTVMAMLAKAPSERPDSAEVRRSLKSVVLHEGLGNGHASAAATTSQLPLNPTPQAVWMGNRTALPDPDEAPPAEANGRRLGVRVAAVLAAIALAAGVALYVGVADGSGAGGKGGRQAAVRRARTGSGPRTTGISGTGEGASPTSAGSATSPKQTGGTSNTTSGATTTTSEWRTFTDPSRGFHISYPPGWDVNAHPTDATSVDFRDPVSGTYLRADWTDTPGTSPEKSWLAFEPGFKANHDNYRRIQITPTTFQGYDAALWEFTYSESGADLHAADLGFVTGDFGFALFFQTHADDWASSQDLFHAFKNSFEAPA